MVGNHDFFGAGMQGQLLGDESYHIGIVEPMDGKIVVAGDFMIPRIKGWMALGGVHEMDFHDGFIGVAELNRNAIDGGIVHLSAPFNL